MGEAGRPPGTGYQEEQYRAWLLELEPFLRLGQTLSSAIEDAGLYKHRATLYEKFRLGDYFSDRVKVLQAIPGKLANNILTKTLMNVNNKIKQELPVTDEDMRNVRFMAEKHRSAQPYFVTRIENSESKEEDLGKVLDIFEGDYADFESSDEASSEQTASEQGEGATASSQAPTQQEVALNSPIQSKEQTGPVGDVQAEQNPAQALATTGQPQA